MKKMNVFIKGFVAKVTGDDATALGAKVWLKAESALKVQIATMEGDLIKLEDDLTNAEDKLVDARLNNGKDITDRSVYADNLIAAENVRRKAEKALKDHNSLLAFFKTQYEELGKEVKE